MTRIYQKMAPTPRVSPLLLAFAVVVIGFGAQLRAADRPNILWITSEDNGISWVGCYGGVNAKTPAIDRLAKEGFRYTYCFDNAAVCAPTRSCWITRHVRDLERHANRCEAATKFPHDKIKYYPDLLKKAGYHTSNPGKTDYNIGGRNDKQCWDYGRGKEKFGWRKRKPGQPFFAVVNIGDSHESRAHGNVDNPPKDPAKMKLFSYHPDLPVIRQNYAKYAGAVERMDRKVQQTLDALKKDGLEEDTIVIYNSDHGGVMARSKRFLYSSGVHCPLVIRIPKKFQHLYPADKPGVTVDRIVSFVDMPKTWLSLAGAEIPETFQGTIFLGENAEPAPRYHLGFRERADERLDHVRLIRDRRFAYHKNYMPFAPAGQHLAYLWKARATDAWEKHHRAGKTNEVSGRFFRPRVSEEFYDNQSDFDNVKNLIGKSEHQAKIAELKAELRKRQLELFDSGLLPEKMRERRAAANQMTIYEMVRKQEAVSAGEISGRFGSRAGPRRGQPRRIRRVAKRQRRRDALVGYRRAAPVGQRFGAGDRSYRKGSGGRRTRSPHDGRLDAGQVGQARTGTRLPSRSCCSTAQSTERCCTTSWIGWANRRSRS